MRRPTVLLADDHPIVAEGLTRLLAPHFEMVGAVDDGWALLQEARRLQPDLVVLDVSMPLLNGIDAARRLKSIAPRSKIVFLSMHGDRDYVSGAFAAGGSGYLLKSSFSSELVFALQEVLRGRYYVAPAVAKNVVSSVLDHERPSRKRRPRARSGLTARQQEVLQLVAEGKSAKEIASILSVSVKTVEFHKSRITNALDLHTTAELTRYAIQQGLVAL